MFTRSPISPGIGVSVALRGTVAFSSSLPRHEGLWGNWTPDHHIQVPLLEIHSRGVRRADQKNHCSPAALQISRKEGAHLGLVCVSPFTTLPGTVETPLGESEMGEGLTGRIVGVGDGAPHVSKRSDPPHPALRCW